MKVSLNGLLGYITPTGLQFPADWGQLHNLLEDIGLEVKRVEQLESDIVFTLELLANRGDHHCYVGLARELHIRTSWPLSSLVLQELDRATRSPLASVTSDSCLAYTLTEYRLDQEQTGLTDQMLGLIELSGTNIIAPAVDITNFVNIEMGQPMHVFDAEKIAGAIEVRDSRPDETAHLLGASEPVKLPEKTLVIADSEKVLAVAGVMGCETSKPTLESRRLLLESGTFDPVAVRKAARFLGVQSLSSARFERGADPALAVNAVYRAHALLAAAGWAAVDGLGVCKAYEPTSSTISVSLAGLNHYFALQVSVDAVVPIFQRMGSPSVRCEGDLIQVQVPSHRLWDIVSEADLFEEFARAVGYNELPAVMPSSASGERPTRSQRRLEEVESLLVSEGFYEIFTDSFYSDQDVARLGELPPDHELSRHVRINNSETKAYSLLKNNNLVQALGAVEANARVKHHEIKAFEKNKRFLLNPQATNGLCDELKVIWGLVAGDMMPKTWQGKSLQVDIFQLKGLIERISGRLGLGLTIVPKPEDDRSHAYLALLHPQRRAVISRIYGDGRETVVGVLGEVHPGVVKSFGLKAVRPYFFEIEQEILNDSPISVPYKAPGTILLVKRDLCFGLYQRQPAGYIADWLDQASPWLDRVDVSDLFETHDDAGQTLRAVTFSLYLDPVLAGKEVFSGAEMNDEVERIANAAVDHFGADKVHRR